MDYVIITAIKGGLESQKPIESLIIYKFLNGSTMEVPKSIKRILKCKNGE